MHILDTNVILDCVDMRDLVEEYKELHIPIEALEELDGFKYERTERGFRARRGIREIKNNFDYIKFLYDQKSFKESSTDNKILGYLKDDPSSVIISNDIAVQVKAQILDREYVEHHEVNDFPISIISAASVEAKEFLFQSFDGKYIIFEDSGFIFKREGEEWNPISSLSILGNYLYKIEAFDSYQKCAINSLLTDDFTVITGKAGSGKSLLSLAYCLQRVNTGSKVHIFVNPVKTRGSEELGYYSGGRTEKLMQNFIGDILRGKIGDSMEVEKLLDNNEIILYPFSDIRGIEIPAGDVLYITEAQNISIDLMRVALQRCAAGSKIIIEGDPAAQIDKFYDNNGLKRIIKVFHGFEGYSHVHLERIYRSRLAEKAEEL